MEIKILVKENEKAELDKFIETCKEHGMELTREGGGKLPNFSGYYAEFKGVRWQKDDTDKRQSNIPDVSTSVSVPSVRVRFYPADTDETFDGTVIDEKPNYYVVIPDQNLQLTQNWNKKRCDVLH